MIQIRRSVFETNSSSSHSISVKKSGRRLSDEEVRESFKAIGWKEEGWDGYIDLTEDTGDCICFGRTPFQILDTPESKLRFLLASTYIDDSESMKEIYFCLQRILPGFKGIRLWSRVGKRWSERLPKEDRETKEEPEYGYADEAMGLARDFLKKHSISADDFLADERYWVFIDGDETCMTTFMFRSGQLKEEDFDVIGYDGESA